LHLRHNRKGAAALQGQSAYNIVETSNIIEVTSGCYVLVDPFNIASYKEELDSIE
jgi:hypothetical protein